MRLRFIKSWGTYRVGDIKVSASPTTIMWLVDRHKVAVIDSDPPPVAQQLDVAIDDMPKVKYLRRPKRDKMLKSPTKAKAERGEFE